MIFKRVIVTARGGTGVMEVVQEQLRSLAPNEVRVRTLAALVDV
jgi:hypothetical protein